jgi:hypothetical protein
MAAAPTTTPRSGSDMSGRTLVLAACEVRRWRGYVSSEFYARRVDDLSTVATSGTFRWRKKASPPDRGAAREAFDRLRAELVGLGWRDTGTTASWFERRFERYEAAAVPIFAEPAIAESRPPEPVASREAARVPVVGPVPVGVDPDAVPRPSGADVPVAVTPEADGPSDAISRTRRRGRLAAIAGALLVAAGAVGGWFGFQSGWFKHQAPPHRTAAVAAAPSSRPPASTAAATTVAAGPATPPRGAPASPPRSVSARLQVSGRGPGSWLEVRRGSKHGAVLFAGVIAHGKHMRFDGRRLWVMFGAATNLAITVNGEREPLQGTVEALVTLRGLTAP